MEKVLELDIPILLPQVADVRDQCIARLQELLSGKRGITNAHVHYDRTPAQLCLHYDPALASLEDVRRAAERAGAAVTNRYHHELLNVEGMDCGDCATVIEHTLGRLDGVVAASVNYPTGKVRVEYDAEKTSHKVIVARVRTLGYEVGGEKRTGGWLRENWELALSLLCGALLATGFVLERLGVPSFIPLAFYLGAYAAGGFDIARHALGALRQFKFDIDVLMLLAALGAALLGDFAEGALLLFLFSLGHALEHYALGRARHAIQALADLSPKTARVSREGHESEIPVEQLQRGDIVIVRAGERIPIDGRVLAGQSAVNQAPITGESVPVEKNVGDSVFAGTINGDGSQQVRVTKLARDTTLARVTQIVEEAQTQKAPTQRFTEKFESIYVPAVLITALVLIVVPPLLGVAPVDVAFYRAMALLVAASPCALAIGTPAAVLAGIAQGARNGVLIKGGAHLENLGTLNAIAFDKTGTITEGRPTVTDVLPNPDANMNADELLALAASAESRSTHPLAQAIVRGAQDKKLTLAKVDSFEALQGRGLRATVNGATLLIGAPKWFGEENITLSETVRAQVQDLEQKGKTTILIAHDSTWLGTIALADQPRAGVQAMLQKLRALGLRATIMLTGDNPRVASAIAHQVGLTEYRADLLPGDKVTAIRDLAREHKAVAMVGDGVNDAPALANATVGIAMGGAGTDVALESADVALMANDLSRLPFAVGLSRASRRIIVQNLAIALGVIALLILATLTGLVGLGIAIFFHEGSTLVVVGNALRLLGFRTDS